MDGILLTSSTTPYPLLIRRGVKEKIIGREF